MYTTGIHIPKPKIIRSNSMNKGSPTYIHINSIKSNKSISPPHPLDIQIKEIEIDDEDIESDQSESDFEEVNESFENSSVSSCNSVSSSVSSLSSLPSFINLKSKSSVCSSTVNLDLNKYVVQGACNESLSKLSTRIKSTGPKSLVNNAYHHHQRPHITANNNKFIDTKVHNNNNNHHHLNHNHHHNYNLPLIEMKTFNLESPLNSDNMEMESMFLSANKLFKNRDERINNKFLILYAIDYNSRIRGYLPNSNNINYELSKHKHLIDFHKHHNLMRISNLARDKLWKSIILEPRSDKCPNGQIDHSHYIYLGNNENRPGNSLTMKNGNYLPWSNKPSLKPTGVLNNKHLNNGPNPNSGVSRSQYTIKGWTNSRWIDSSKDLVY